jgi:hypothetical protein
MSREMKIKIWLMECATQYAGKPRGERERERRRWMKEGIGADK